LTHWLLSSKYLEYLCNEEAIQRIKDKVQAHHSFILALDQSPLAEQQKQQDQLLQLLQEQSHLQQKLIQERSKELKSLREQLQLQQQSMQEQSQLLKSLQEQFQSLQKAK